MSNAEHAPSSSAVGEGERSGEADASTREAPDTEADATDADAARDSDGPSTAGVSTDRWTRARAVLTRLQAIAGWMVAAAAGVAFGYSFGFDYGVDNQVVYLLGALNIVKPELYANDWLVQHTTHYHPVYEYLCAALLAIDSSGWPVAIALTVVGALGSLGLYWILRTLLRRGALVAFILLITLLRITATRGVAVSYIIDHILQPSTLGACGTIFAIAFFMRGKYLGSGIALALAGLCHANYLLLGGLVFGLAHLFLGPRDLPRRGLRQLGLPALAVLLLSPLIIKAAFSAHAEQARFIYFDIRAPHHFDPAHFRGDFTPFVAWHLLGLGLGLPLMRKAGGIPRRFAAITAALMAIVWLGTLFTTAFKVPQVANLFPWRLSPFVLLMLQIATCASAVRLFLDPAYYKKFAPIHIALTLAGLGYFAINWGMRKNEPLWNMPFAIFGLGALGYALGLALDLGRRSSRIEPLLKRMNHPALHGLVSVGLLAWSAAVWNEVYPKALKAAKARSNLVRGFDSNLSQLYDWMHTHAPVDAVFLTPPAVETMRFRGERAIIVDWKANPIVPDELIEWHQRLADVTGRPNFRGAGDLRGYDALDRRRLDALKRKYRVDFVVVDRGRERQLPGLPVVFRNARYTVLDARGGSA